MKTQDELRDQIKSAVDDLISDSDSDCSRETLLDLILETTDSLFGSLVRHGRIDQYDVFDMVDTAADCAAIIELARTDAWEVDDSGLWEGFTYGVLAAIAFHSLENLIHQYLQDAGVDTNADDPF